jgi:hypothetical protein
MQPVTLNGPPTYFNSSGSPSLAMRWAGNAATAVSAKYGAVEIGPAATNPRAFWVLGFVSHLPDQDLYIYNTTATKLDAVQQTNAPNSTTEFGSVASTSIVKSGVTADVPADTDSRWECAFHGQNVRFERVPMSPLFIPAGNFFTAVAAEADSATGFWFQFAEIVK